MATMTKFHVNLSEAMHELIADLSSRLDVPMADAIREALSLYGWMANEYEHGNKLLVQRGDDVTELVIPTLDRLKPRPGRPREVLAVDGGRSSSKRRRSPGPEQAPTSG